MCTKSEPKKNILRKKEQSLYTPLTPKTRDYQYFWHILFQSLFQA